MREKKEGQYTITRTWPYIFPENFDVLVSVRSCVLVIEPEGVAKLMSYGSLFTWRIPSRNKQRCHLECTLLVWTIFDVLFSRKNEVFRHNYIYSYIRYNFTIPSSKEMYKKGDALAKLLYC